MPGAMNKANARQHTKNKQKYEQQKIRTNLNKERKVEAQRKFQDRKQAKQKED